MWVNRHSSLSDRQNQRGFTIVELLIVIVVIGILAAITIVAYNGVQQKAENTKTVNSVGGYVSALNLYAVDNSSYPNYAYPCLGGVSPCGDLTPVYGICSGQTTTLAAFDAAIATVAKSMPSPSSQSMDCNGDKYGGAYFYATNGGKSASIDYFLKGDVACSPAGASLTGRYQNSNTTKCTVTLPAL